MFLAAIRHNVEFPAQVKLWADVAFGTLPALTPEATAAIREATAGFFVTAVEVLGRAGAQFKLATREIGQLAGRKGPALFMPLRAALTGVTHGPELAPFFDLIPGDIVKARLEAARKLAE